MEFNEIDLQTRLELTDIPQKMADAVIWRNVDQYVSCFAKNGAWDARPLLPEIVEGGPSAVRTAFEGAWTSLEFALQAIYSVRVIEFSGERAKLRTYLGEFGRAKGAEAAPIGFGMYEDDCVLENGRWKVQLHKLTPLYFGSSDWLNPIFLNCPPGKKG